MNFLDTFSPLSDRNFRTYMGGQTISLIGTWMQTTAQGWLVWQLTDKFGIANREAIYSRLAQQVNLSQFHLLRSFHRSFGLPPHAYLNQVRINHANELLANGHSAADVAVRVGFSDQSHLNRHFKRIVGISPGQYKARIKE